MIMDKRDLHVTIYIIFGAKNPCRR